MKNRRPIQGDVAELTVGMGHELVGFLGGCLESSGIVSLVLNAVEYHFIKATDREAGNVDQMFHLNVAAAIQNVLENTMR